MAKQQAKNTICVWYDKDAEAAARFYAATFPNSSVNGVHKAPSDWIVQGTDPQGADFSLVGGNIEESNDEEEHDLPVVRP